MLSANSQLTLLGQHAAEGQDLSASEIEQAIHDLLEPEISVEVKAEFLLCLSRKGETAREIADFAILLRELALDPHIDINLLGGRLLDTCGTGSDGANTFNVSTAAAFVLAAADIPVAKHGNRAITSQCGSADVLEELGVDISMSASKLNESLQKLKIGFLFAPQYHKTFKIIQPVRQLLAKQGQRSIFNLLGPLVNPARPNMQVIGVYDPELTHLYAEVLGLMKLKRGVVVHGFGPDQKPCLDELSTLGLSKISQLHSNGNVETLVLDPTTFGFAKPTIEELKGGDAKANAEIIRALLSGEDKGPRHDLLAYNASLGFVLAGQARDLIEGIEQARTVLSSGAGLARLDAFCDFSKI